MREPRRRRNDARGVALRLSRKWTGEPVRALGARFGGVSGRAVSGVVARVAQCLEEDRSLERRLRGCEKALELDL